jgi:2-methylcitrate dehydratase PrpD
MPSRRQWLTLASTPLWLPTLARANAASAASASQPVSPEMLQLSTYMAQAPGTALPPDVAEQAKHHVLDTLASIVSGAELEPGHAARRYVSLHAGQGRVPIVGMKGMYSAGDAALVHGMMAHADETDDSHNRSRTHPGCAVVPAAMAVAQALGCEGSRFLQSVALGYDIGTRIVMAMGGFDLSYKSSLATHSIGGNFCAAAAAAGVAGLNPQQMRWVLDYASQQSSGILAWRRDTDHIEKSFVFGGMPARNGVTSALGVHAGWTGVTDIFSGQDNFFQAYAPNAKRELLTQALGSRFEIALTDLKKWTVGSPIQGPLDAIELMQQRTAFTADQVRTVTVRLAPSVAAVVDNRDMPDICLQHMVAVMLMDRTASFKAAHDTGRMSQDATRHHRNKVQLVADESLVPLLPVRVAIVEIELTDGRRLSERVSAVRGTPRNPMTRQEVVAKATDLMAPVLGDASTRRLIDSVYHLESVPDVRVWMPLLATAG